jgi:hypothetical protein
VDLREAVNKPLPRIKSTHETTHVLELLDRFLDLFMPTLVDHNQFNSIFIYKLQLTNFPESGIRAPHGHELSYNSITPPRAYVPFYFSTIVGGLYSVKTLELTSSTGDEGATLIVSYPTQIFREFFEEVVQDVASTIRWRKEHEFES